MAHAEAPVLTWLGTFHYSSLCCFCLEGTDGRDLLFMPSFDLGDVPPTIVFLSQEAFTAPRHVPPVDPQWYLHSQLDGSLLFGA